MTEFRKGLCVGMIFMFVVFGVVDLLFPQKAQIDRDKAKFIIWLKTETGETHKAIAVLNDNGESIIGHSVFITCFELEYLAPELTTEIRRSQ